MRASVSPGEIRYDDGFPQDAAVLLVVSQDGDEYLVYLRNVRAPFLLYAQFANRQREQGEERERRRQGL